MRRPELLMLLLCCPLGRRIKPLSNQEYHRFAQCIYQNSSLLGKEPMTVPLLLRLGCSQEEARRIEGLLYSERPAQAYLRARPEVNVLPRLSADYPAALRRLPDPPAALFTLGDPSLLSMPKISLVGNRRISEQGYDFAQKVGILAAQRGFALVSGNAIGADRIAQQACLQAGGKVISFLPGSLPPRAEANILYCSDEGYDCSFSSTRALRRNHYIHAIGDLTFLAQCRETRGGTWDGALYNLQHKLSPLWILPDGSPGSEELIFRGVHPLSNEEDLSKLFHEVAQFT